MRILVTGGAGFIGSNFIAETLDRRPEVEVVVLDAYTYAAQGPRFEACQYLRGSIADADLLDSVLPNVDHVIHFAAETHNDNSLEFPLRFIETNVLGTAVLLQACVKFDVPIHHISTDEVFGDLPLHGKEKFSLSTPYAPSSPYSASKAAADHLVRAWSRSFGLRATISNCGNNYGPNQHAEKFIPSIVRSIVTGVPPKVYGNGLNKRDWVHVRDHSRAIWKILDGGFSDATFLVSAGCVRTNLEIVGAINKTLGLPEDYYELVEDRPGHDLRYELDGSGTYAQLEWEPEYPEIERAIGPVIEHYVTKFSKAS